MTGNATTRLAVPARVMMALIFVVAGFGKLAAPDQTIALMQSSGLQGMLYYPTVFFEIVAGLALMLALFPRSAALLLAGFSIVSGILFHCDISDPDQMVSLLKNLAIAGGLLLVVQHGSHNLSLGQATGLHRQLCQVHHA
jgi:putative oxidoreductase